MRKRLAAAFAVMALGLIPAFAGATDAPPAEEGATTVLVKAYSTVVSVAPESITLDVVEAYEWVDGSDKKVSATGINGQRITAAITPKSIVRRGDKAVGLDTLTPGTSFKALMSTDAQPVTPTLSFTFLEGYIEVPKVHPGDKFEKGFFHRLWHVRGSVLGLETVDGRNVMNLDVRRLDNAPKRFRDEGSRLTRMDAYVVVSPRVVITGTNGRRITFAELAVDDRVKVVVKALPKSKWVADESGEPTPTFLAKRIKVRG